MFISEDVAYVDRDVWECEFHLIGFNGQHMTHTLWIDGDCTEESLEIIGREWFAANWQGPELISIGLGGYFFDPIDEDDLFWEVHIVVLFRDKTWGSDHYIVQSQTESAAKAIALAEAISFSKTLPNPEFCEWFFIAEAKITTDLDTEEKLFIKGEK